MGQASSRLFACAFGYVLPDRHQKVYNPTTSMLECECRMKGPYHVQLGQQLRHASQAFLRAIMACTDGTTPWHETRAV
jgi:hypothetical protein